MIRIIYGKARTGKTSLARSLAGAEAKVLGTHWNGLLAHGGTVKTYFQPGVKVEECRNRRMFDIYSTFVIDDYPFMTEEEWVDIQDKAPKANFVLIGDPLFADYHILADEHESLASNQQFAHLDGVRGGDLSFVERLPWWEPKGLFLTSQHESVRLNLASGRAPLAINKKSDEISPLLFAKNRDSCIFASEKKVITGLEHFYIGSKQIKLNDANFSKVYTERPSYWGDFRGITVGDACIDLSLSEREIYYSLTRVTGKVTVWNND